MSAAEFDRESLQDDRKAFCPYPGLRPFQPDDADYYFGRDQQVEDVIGRLTKSRFVAVIGGSGSGKSSLVLAGAIPRLRAYAIKGTGDFWIPVISSPGTNHSGDSSPLRRLAKNICDLLTQPAGDSSSLLEEILAVLRRKDGLGEIVSRFGKRLRYSGNVDLSLEEVKVNFLFLVDQFEELFHPSNLNHAIEGDCKHLVDRIIEQFRRPHTQVCVALTMRSEHLNDCTRYEDLPDAINGSAYLVKRLDINQLREAIEGPVVRYLRLQLAHDRNRRRAAGNRDSDVEISQAWPDSITFEPKVVERLLADSSALLARQDHADHLPLLQHLLFWIWVAARLRADDQIPQSLTWADLRSAVVGVGEEAGDEPIDEDLNTLEACIENKCESIFASNPERQTRWECLFRSLAFKEPNTGTYTQQRVELRTLRNPLSLEDDSESEERILAPWISPHRYIQSDNDNRTIKVAHETLIRRWSRFRRWIDADDIQYQVYLRLLDDCARWELSDRNDTYLISGAVLRRYSDAAISEALNDHTRSVRLSQLLSMDREGERLARYQDTALEFLLLSKDTEERQEAEVKEAQKQRKLAEEMAAEAKHLQEVQQAEAVAKEKASTITKRALLGFIAFLLLVALIVGPLIMIFTKERTLMSSYQAAVEMQLVFDPNYRDLNGAQLPLRNMLVGAQILDEGRKKRTAYSDWPLLNRIYRGGLGDLEELTVSADAHNVTGIRSVLELTPWGIEAPKIDDSSLPTPLKCALKQQPANSAEFYSPAGSDVGLIVGNDGTHVFIYFGTMPKSGVCEGGQLLGYYPTIDGPRVRVVGDLRHVLIESPGVLEFDTIYWNSMSMRRTATLQKDPKKQYLPQQATLELLPYKRPKLDDLEFASDVKLGEETVRLFDIEPSPIDKADGAGWQDFKTGNFVGKTPPAHSDWDLINAEGLITKRDNITPLALGTLVGQDGHTYCLLLEWAEGSGQSPATHLVSLYRIDADHRNPGGLMATPLIEEVLVGLSRPQEFRMNAKSGLLAFGSRGWLGVPWSLSAMRNLAHTVFVPGQADMHQEESGDRYRGYNRLFHASAKPPDSTL